MSLIIPAADYAVAKSLGRFLELLDLDTLPEDMDATRVALEPSAERPLPPTPEFEGSELLEALFLEDLRPVVVFDASSPELVATRLITALWPTLRRQFAMSTFALSPRKIGGQDFNLVFGPKDARAKFSDWSGRKVDGRSSHTSRHRWTGTIVSRVFDDPFPKLLSSDEEGLVAIEGNAGENAAALRIALLWDELLAKLDTTPTAALGLMDIANSGKVRGWVAQQMLEPILADAVRRSPSALPEDEAWNFLGAMARKLHGRDMEQGAEALEFAVANLATHSPEGGLALLSQPDDRGIFDTLLPIIANSIGDGFTDRAREALLSTSPNLVGNLIAESSVLAGRIASAPSMGAYVSQILPTLDTHLLLEIRKNLLPLLVMDWQLPIADPLLRSLDAGELAAEIRHLGSFNDFEALALAGTCIKYAREIGAKSAALNALVELPGSKRRDVLLAASLDPSVEDVAWLIRSPKLPAETVTAMLAGALIRASDRQLSAILCDVTIGAQAIGVVQAVAPELLRRMIFFDGFPIETFASLANNVIANVPAGDKVAIAKRVLERCLPNHFGGNEDELITKMLGIWGTGLDAPWVVRSGLEQSVYASVASRNMVAFQKAPPAARANFVRSVEEMAHILKSRRSFDLDEFAADSYAQFLFDAEKTAPQAALAAAGHLVPILMRQRNSPVSLMIAAAFPLIYRELAKEDEVPDLLKLVPFFDWDRCKAARQELASAFLSSSWPPGHLALVACRCSDVSKILRRVVKAYGGEAYLNRVASDLARVPTTCRRRVQKAITAIRSDWSSKYDWRD